LTLTIIYLAVILYSSIVGLTKFRSLDRPFRLLTLLPVGTFVSETISTICWQVFRNNSLSGKIYLPFHILLFGAIYYYLFDKKSIRRMIIAFTIVFLITSIFVMCFVRTDRILPTDLITIECLLLVSYSILYFFKLFQAPTEEEIVNSSKLWFNSNVLIYCASTSVIWISFHYLYIHGRFFPGLGLILTLLNTFHYSLLGVALHLYKTNPNPVVDGKDH